MSYKSAQKALSKRNFLRCIKSKNGICIEKTNFKLFPLESSVKRKFYFWNSKGDKKEAKTEEICSLVDTYDHVRKPLDIPQLRMFCNKNSFKLMYRTEADSVKHFYS